MLTWSACRCSPCPRHGCAPSTPNEDSIVRLVGAVLLEQNNEYQLQHRNMQIEGMAALATPMIEEVLPLQLTPKAA